MLLGPGFRLAQLAFLGGRRLLTGIGLDLLDRDLALAQLARFRAAFPRRYREWSEDNARVLDNARAASQSRE